MTTVVTNFDYTGAMQTFTVPAGVSSISIIAQGSSGGSWGSGGGGTGGNVHGTLAVSGGQVLNVFVGGGGGQSNGGIPGPEGYNGGGRGGSTAGQAGFYGGAGGGGATDIRSGGTALANRILIAGGGGGATNNVNGGGGGALGGTAAAGAVAHGGGGGTQSAGGAGGGISGIAGVLGVGGAGNGNTVKDGGGGAGGGYYGGGGGGFASGGLNPAAGGGGSSFQTGFTATSSTAGTSGGNPFVSPFNDGYVSISYVNNAPNAPTLVAPINYGYADAENATLDWTFTDPDVADFQTKADIRYRVNAGPWTTLMGVVSGQTSNYVLTGLTVGFEYEWQARTYDSQGEVGAYSASFFFTATLSPLPIFGFLSPTPGQPITDLTTQGINWTHTLRNQSGYNARRVADFHGIADAGTIYETIAAGTSSANTKFFTDTAVHRNGPEHWQIQFTTYNGTVISEWYDFYVVMSYDAPQAPLCVATAQPLSGAISVTEQFADLVEDYYSKSVVPTVADTGQALTSFGSPAMNGVLFNALLYNATTVFGQSANLGAKCLSAAVTFQLHDIAATHANSISILAGDSAFTNCYLFCSTTRTGWSISKVVAGAQTVLASGAYAQLLPGPAVPLTMTASIVGTTITFTDPFDIVHTATDAVIGSQTGTFFKVSVDNTGVTTPDHFQIAHWSASDLANPAAYATLARSTDGVTFAPIPGAEWDTQDYGAIFAYTDYTPPFNTRTYYRVNAYTLGGALVQSVVT